MKFGLVAVVIIALVAAGYFGAKHLQQRQKVAETKDPEAAKRKKAARTARSAADTMASVLNRTR